jgi:hypothetical protein
MIRFNTGLQTEEQAQLGLNAQETTYTCELFHTIQVMQCTYSGAIEQVTA